MRILLKDRILDITDVVDIQCAPNSPNGDKPNILFRRHNTALSEREFFDNVDEMYTCFKNIISGLKPINVEQK